MTEERSLPVDSSPEIDDDGPRLTRLERRTSVALASIYALRMLGLFLVLPVLAIHARTLPGGSDVALLGFTLGVYGLTQACLQIPFGVASDRFGRKPVIVVGLLVFALGSFVAAMADTLAMMAAGRALQGAGAISAAVTALLADATREVVRTRAMAMIGGSIGLTFALSMILGPSLYPHIGMGGLFGLTGVLALGAIIVVLKLVPDVPMSGAAQGAGASSAGGWRAVLVAPELLRLNLGIFLLHLMQVAMFVAVPVALVQQAHIPVAHHWKIYFSALLVGLILMVPAIIAAEKHGRMRAVFLAAVLLLAVTELVFALGWTHPVALIAAIVLFFFAFNILEACLPSLVSRAAPREAKGLALGVYNTTQSLGLFAGGLLGGKVGASYGYGAVFGLCAVLAVIWLMVAWFMHPAERRL